MVCVAYAPPLPSWQKREVTFKPVSSCQPLRQVWSSESESQERKAFGIRMFLENWGTQEVALKDSILLKYGIPKSNQTST